MAQYDSIQYDGPSFLNEWTDLRRWYDRMDFPTGEGCRFRACLVQKSYFLYAEASGLWCATCTSSHDMT